VLLGGGRFVVFVADPELALLSFALLAGAAGAGCLAVARGVAAWRAAAWAFPLVGWTALCSGSALSPRVAAEALLWQLVGVGLYWLGLSLARRPEDVARVFGALAPAIAGLAAVGVGQALGWLPIAPVYTTELHKPRVLSLLNHPNNLAGFVALVLPPVVGRLAACVARRRWSGALGWAVLGVALLVNSAATYSRGGQLGLLCGLAGGLAMALRGAPRRMVSARTRLAWLVAVSALLVALWYSPLGFRLRLTAANLPHLAQDERAGTWLAAARMVREHPWRGVGPGCFWLAFPSAKTAASHPNLFTHAHNWYLHTAAEGGWPALLALLALLAVPLRGLAGALRGGDSPTRFTLAGLWGGLAGFGVAGVLDFNVGLVGIAACFWLLAGVGAAGEGHSAVEDHPLTPSVARRARLTRWAAGGVGVALALLSLAWIVWNRGQAAYMTACGALAKGDPARAAPALEQARRLDPGQRAYDLVRADLARMVGDDARALTLLDRLNEGRAPLDTAWRVQLGWLRGRAGDRAGARAVWDAALAADPASVALRTEAGLYELLLGGDSPRAERLLGSAAAAGNHQVAALVGQAVLARRRGDAGGVRERLDQAARLFVRGESPPRFLLGYGRVDPLVLMGPGGAGRLPVDRAPFAGPLLSGVLPLLELIAQEAAPSPARPGSAPPRP